MRRCLVLLTVAMMLTGCKKGEIPTETEDAYVDTTQCSFSIYDDTFSFALNSNEHFLELTDTSASIKTDDDKSVTVDYVEGNSLNDFEKAYKTATGSDNCIFLKSESNDYLMVKYEEDSKDLANDLVKRVAIKEKK